MSDYEDPLKMVSTGYIRSDFTVAGTVTCLNCIELGNTAWNRIGRSVKLTSLIIRGHIGGGSNLFSDTLRFLVVYDRQTNGATPTASDILKDYLSNGSTMTNSTSCINQANADRFSVVMDIANRSPQTTPTGIYAFDSRSRFELTSNIPLAELHQQFKSDSSPATVADIATGALWLLTISKETAGTWGFYGTFTVEFDDTFP